ncbi:LysE family translocator [Pseudomonas sp. CCC3.1]|uniref:LysE family translocator n=1 Tax=Pseudomonas sp. CCC3.1 TaxID=3048607 RepID=UPI002AC91B37|nr:LysE family translocator [Pseudomonas sp. CCC3.1]MEB0205160.1 LysE family translocator [Pseudomonas sp. CCC3.1]WPX38447.1 LysE family translocator [Pseudomonas sp. CCC3.1]
MVSINDWLSFTFIALIVTLTPGPAVIMSLSNSVSHGPWRAMIGSLGNAIGLLIIASATSAGLGALLIASATAFLVLKVAGASYLIYLGVKQWRSRNHAFDNVRSAPAVDVSAWKLFSKGFSVAITNPKAILFFAAFLPQFIQGGNSSLSYLTVLIFTFAGCSIVAHLFYALLAQTLKGYLSSPARAKALNRLFGVSFMGLGVSLLTIRGKVA